MGLVYGLDLISSTDGAGNRRYFSYDGLGSTSDLTDAAGTVTDTYSYDVFGAVRARTGTNASPWKFTGEQEDGAAGDTGYYFLRARYLDVATGRFISRDPLEFDQRYAYAGGNPVVYVDPSGLEPQDGGDSQRGMGGASGSSIIGAQGGRLAGPRNYYAPQAPLKMSEQLEGHVLKRHVRGGPRYVEGKTSYFLDDVDIEAKIWSGAGEHAFFQERSGNWVRTVLADEPVGVWIQRLPDGSYINRGVTNIYTIVTDAAGRLITAFPGLANVVP